MIVQDSIVCNNCHAFAIFFRELITERKVTEMDFFNFYRQCLIGLFLPNSRELSVDVFVVVVVDIPRQVIRTFIYIG